MKQKPSETPRNRHLLRSVLFQWLWIKASDKCVNASCCVRLHQLIYLILFIHSVDLVFKIELCENEILLEICQDRPHEGLFKVKLSSVLDIEAGFSALNSHYIHLYISISCVVS